MKNKKLMLIVGIFLMIFSIDGILFLDSIIPECKGFMGMGWFVFFVKGFEPMAILSNSECLTSFYIQTGSSILFISGLSLVINQVMKKRKGKIYCEYRK